MLQRSPVFLAHAAADHAYARELAAFLEAGCDVRCDPDEGLLRPGQDLVELAEQCSGHLVLLLSKDSWPERLPRQRWGSVLLELPLGCMLVNPRPFPELLRRRAFFDVKDGNARRGLKRWLWQQQRDPSETARFQWSADLEELYVRLADQPGVQTSSAERARRFAREAADEFEYVLWVPCHGRNLVECTGELGAQLGMILDEPEKENRRRILAALAAHRCLVVLDAPAEPVRSALPIGGRSSSLTTAEPFEIRETPRTFACAMELVRGKRLAEAYDILYLLLEEGADTGACARELAWICEHWDRAAEAARLRQFDPIPAHQMGLFEVE